MERGVDGGWDRLALIDDFHDVAAETRDDAHLLDVALPGLDRDAEHRRTEHVAAECRKAEGLKGVDQQIAPGLLVLVAGQPGPAQKRRRVTSPCRQRSKEALPVLVKHPHDLLGYFGWQGLVRLVVLHPLMHLGVAQVDTLEDEALPKLVVGRVVEVLGGEGRAVNGGKAPVGTCDDVLLNQLHRRPPAPPARTQSPPSCASPAAGHRAERRTSRRWR